VLRLHTSFGPVVFKRDARTEYHQPVGLAGVAFAYFLRDGSPGSILFLLVIAVSVVNFILESDKDLGVDAWVWQTVEFVCVSIFTLEFALRFLYARRKIFWVVKPMTLIDLVAIIPFYVELLLRSSGDDADGEVINLSWVRILRLMRAVRVIKLGRALRGVRVFMKAIVMSFPQLCALFFMIGLACIVFSTLLYIVEDDLGVFTNIPVTLWWGIVTMTTVGYGDYAPVTLWGRLIGVASMLAGTLILSLPITVIGNNFARAVLADEVLSLKEVLQDELHCDKDGGLSLEELKRALKSIGTFSSTAIQLNKQVVAAFNKFDTDSSGNLSQDEVVAMMDEIEMQLSDFQFGQTDSSEKTDEAILSLQQQIVSMEVSVESLTHMVAELNSLAPHQTSCPLGGPGVTELAHRLERMEAILDGMQRGSLDVQFAKTPARLRAQSPRCEEAQHVEGVLFDALPHFHGGGSTMRSQEPKAPMAD